jgi:hypothetical protein
LWSTSSTIRGEQIWWLRSDWLGHSNGTLLLLASHHLWLGHNSL